LFCYTCLARCGPTSGKNPGAGCAAHPSLNFSGSKGNARTVMIILCHFAVFFLPDFWPSQNMVVEKIVSQQHSIAPFIHISILVHQQSIVFCFNSSLFLT
jgi:hypothetical protein